MERKSETKKNMTHLSMEQAPQTDDPGIGTQWRTGRFLQRGRDKNTAEDQRERISELLRDGHETAQDVDKRLGTFSECFASKESTKVIEDSTAKLNSKNAADTPSSQSSPSPDKGRRRKWRRRAPKSSCVAPPLSSKHRPRAQPAEGLGKARGNARWTTGHCFSLECNNSNVHGAQKTFLTKTQMQALAASTSAWEAIRTEAGHKSAWRQVGLGRYAGGRAGGRGLREIIPKGRPRPERPSPPQTAWIPQVTIPDNKQGRRPSDLGGVLAVSRVVPDTKSQPEAQHPLPEWAARHGGKERTTGGAKTPLPKSAIQEEIASIVRSELDRILPNSHAGCTSTRGQGKGSVLGPAPPSHSPVREEAAAEGTGDFSSYVSSLVDADVFANATSRLFRLTQDCKEREAARARERQLRTPTAARKEASSPLCEEDGPGPGTGGRPAPVRTLPFLALFGPTRPDWYEERQEIGGRIVYVIRSPKKSSSLLQRLLASVPRRETKGKRGSSVFSNWSQGVGKVQKRLVARPQRCSVSFRRRSTLDQMLGFRKASLREAYREKMMQLLECPTWPRKRLRKGPDAGHPGLTPSAQEVTPTEHTVNASRKGVFDEVGLSGRGMFPELRLSFHDEKGTVYNTRERLKQEEAKRPWMRIRDKTRRRRRRRREVSEEEKGQKMKRKGFKEKMSSKMRRETPAGEKRTDSKTVVPEKRRREAKVVKEVAEETSGTDSIQRGTRLGFQTERGSSTGLFGSEATNRTMVWKLRRQKLHRRQRVDGEGPKEDIKRALVKFKTLVPIAFSATGSKRLFSRRKPALDATLSRQAEASSPGKEIHEDRSESTLVSETHGDEKQPVCPPTKHGIKPSIPTEAESADGNESNISEVSHLQGSNARGSLRVPDSPKAETGVDGDARPLRRSSQDLDPHRPVWLTADEVEAVLHYRGKKRQIYQEGGRCTFQVPLYVVYEVRRGSSPRSSQGKPRSEDLEVFKAIRSSMTSGKGEANKRLFGSDHVETFEDRVFCRETVKLYKAYLDVQEKSSAEPRLLQLDAKCPNEPYDHFYEGQDSQVARAGNYLLLHDELTVVQVYRSVKTKLALLSEDYNPLDLVAVEFPLPSPQPECEDTGLHQALAHCVKSLQGERLEQAQGVLEASRPWRGPGRRKGPGEAVCRTVPFNENLGWSPPLQPSVSSEEEGVSQSSSTERVSSVSSEASLLSSESLESIASEKILIAAGKTHPPSQVVGSGNVKGGLLQPLQRGSSVIASKPIVGDEARLLSQDVPSKSESGLTLRRDSSSMGQTFSVSSLSTQLSDLVGGSQSDVTSKSSVASTLGTWTPDQSSSEALESGQIPSQSQKVSGRAFKKKKARRLKKAPSVNRRRSGAFRKRRVSVSASRVRKTSHLKVKPVVRKRRSSGKSTRDQPSSTSLEQRVPGYRVYRRPSRESIKRLARVIRRRRAWLMKNKQCDVMASRYLQRSEFPYFYSGREAVPVENFWGREHLQELGKFPVSESSQDFSCSCPSSGVTTAEYALLWPTRSKYTQERGDSRSSHEEQPKQKEAVNKAKTTTKKRIRRSSVPSGSRRSSLFLEAAPFSVKRRRSLDHRKPGTRQSHLAVLRETRQSLSGSLLQDASFPLRRGSDLDRLHPSSRTFSMQGLAQTASVGRLTSDVWSRSSFRGKAVVKTPPAETKGKAVQKTPSSETVGDQSQKGKAVQRKSSVETVGGQSQKGKAVQRNSIVETVGDRCQKEALWTRDPDDGVGLVQSHADKKSAPGGGEKALIRTETEQRRSLADGKCVQSPKERDEKNSLSSWVLVGKRVRVQEGATQAHVPIDKAGVPTRVDGVQQDDSVRGLPLLGQGQPVHGKVPADHTGMHPNKVKSAEKGWSEQRLPLVLPLSWKRERNPSLTTPLVEGRRQHKPEAPRLVCNGALPPVVVPTLTTAASGPSPPPPPPPSPRPPLETSRPTPAERSRVTFIRKVEEGEHDHLAPGRRPRFLVTVNPQPAVTPLFHPDPKYQGGHTTKKWRLPDRREQTVSLGSVLRVSAADQSMKKSLARSAGASFPSHPLDFSHPSPKPSPFQDVLRVSQSAVGWRKPAAADREAASWSQSSAPSRGLPGPPAPKGDATSQWSQQSHRS